VIGVVGGHVIRIEITSVAGGMAIEQANDHGLRDRCGDGRGGNDPAQGMTHGDEEVRPQQLPRPDG
jgi:hypothetical protein